MKSETVQIHFLSDVLIFCHPEILLPWQRHVTYSPLYYAWVQNCIRKTCIACSTKTFLDLRRVFLQYAKIEQVKQKALLAGYTIHNTNKPFVFLPVYMWTQLWKLEVVILIFAKTILVHVF